MTGREKYPSFESVQQNHLIMKGKSWQALDRSLSWSTKIYVLAAILIGLGSFLFNAWSTNWAMTILIALAAVLLVEHFWIVAHRHPKAWRTFKWMVLLIAIALLFL